MAPKRKPQGGKSTNRPTKKSIGKSGKRPLKRLTRSKPTKRTAAKSAGDSSKVRLQKYLASAGIGSRRDCELLIVEGRIEVDNQVVTELGTRIDPETADVRFDGERVRAEKLQYFILNKPPGVVSTSMDPSGRTRVVDLISSHQRVYNVGRLDKSSEGLILVTNDGALAQVLTHPSYGIEKVYLVQVKGHPQPEDLELLKQGVHLAEGVAKVKDVEIKRRQKHSTDLRIVLDEGKNREIRRLLAKLGHKVVRLIRIAIGPIQLGALPGGAHRRLTAEEVAGVQQWIALAAEGKAPSLVRPKKKNARTIHRETDATDPVKIKLAEGRPIHYEDLEKSKALRSGNASGDSRANGEKKPVDKKKPMRFNTKSVRGVGAKRRPSRETGSHSGGSSTGSSERPKRSYGKKSSKTSPGRGTPTRGKTGPGKGRPSRGGARKGGPGKRSGRGGR